MGRITKFIDVNQLIFPRILEQLIVVNIWKIIEKTMLFSYNKNTKAEKNHL